MDEWRNRLTEFVIADAKYKEAKTAFNRSVRIAERLCRNMPGDEDRAWEIAGVALADRRDLKTYQVRRRAIEALWSALRGRYLNEKIKAFGVVWCSDLPIPANNNRSQLSR